MTMHFHSTQFLNDPLSLMFDECCTVQRRIFMSILAVLGIFILNKISHIFAAKKKHNDLLAKMEMKRKSRDAVEHSCFKHEVSKPQAPIADAYELVNDFYSGRRSFTDVMLYSIKRSHSIGKELCAVTEELYDEAYDQCLTLDSCRTSNGKYTSSSKDMILVGVPISIKECFIQKGTDCTLGIGARCFKPAEEDGMLVRLIREAGGIPFVRTNVPQLLMMPDSENRVWGISCNPYDITRTTGGSSGGEGALIASHCSVMGLGSDIGGSIRIPAHYCGICGFKPTPMRFTITGGAVNRLNNRNGQFIILPTSGPMARSVRDLNLMMQALSTNTVRQNEFAPPPLPWNVNTVENGQSIFDHESQDSLVTETKAYNTRRKSKIHSLSIKKTKLKIAMLVSDGWFEPVSACARAVTEAAKALSDAGHEIVPYTVPISTEKMVMTYLALLSADGNWYSFIRALEGEELYDSYKKLQKYTDLPNFLRPITTWFLEQSGEHRKAVMFRTGKSGGLSVREYWEVIADMKEIEKAWKKSFLDNQFDGLIMPTLPIVAPLHGMAAELIPALSYTFLANLLHWPAGVVPVTLVRPDEENYDISSLPAEQRDSIAKLAAESSKGSSGMPVGVQVMTPTWQDENCLFIMSEIEKGIAFSPVPPKFQP